MDLRYTVPKTQAERMRRTLEELVSYHETQAERYLPRGAA
jgi:hypothetical protein